MFNVSYSQSIPVCRLDITRETLFGLLFDTCLAQALGPLPVGTSLGLYRARLVYVFLFAIRESNIQDIGIATAPGPSHPTLCCGAFGSIIRNQCIVRLFLHF